MRVCVHACMCQRVCTLCEYVWIGLNRLCRLIVCECVFQFPMCRVQTGCSHHGVVWRGGGEERRRREEGEQGEEDKRPREEGERWRSQERSRKEDVESTWQDGGGEERRGVAKRWCVAWQSGEQEAAL